MAKIIGKMLKKLIYVILGIAILILTLGVILAFLPLKSKFNRKPLTTVEVAEMRAAYTGTHHLMNTSDGETLFLRQWTPDSIETAKKEVAIVIFHGITAHSGAYSQAAEIISANGYATFGIDYRGHGLSGGNRADYPNKARWIADLSETVDYVKGLGYPKVIILGHSLGVAAAIYATMDIPEKVDGLILMSGAYKGREGVRNPPTFLQTMKILASSVFRPSVQVVEYYRDGMTGIDDPLFNFRYTLRFIRMLDVNELVLPADLDIPILVAMGDKDELFTVDAAKELYEDIPGNQKTFMILEDTYHARFPDESWERLANWVSNNFDY